MTTSQDVIINGIPLEQVIARAAAQALQLHQSSQVNNTKRINDLKSRFGNARVDHDTALQDQLLSEMRNEGYADLAEECLHRAQKTRPRSGTTQEQSIPTPAAAAQNQSTVCTPRTTKNLPLGEATRSRKRKAAVGGPQSSGANNMPLGTGASRLGLSSTASKAAGLGNRLISQKEVPPMKRIKPEVEESHGHTGFSRDIHLSRVIQSVEGHAARPALLGSCPIRKAVDETRVAGSSIETENQVLQFSEKQLTTKAQNHSFTDNVVPQALPAALSVYSRPVVTQISQHPTPCFQWLDGEHSRASQPLSILSNGFGLGLSSSFKDTAFKVSTRLEEPFQPITGLTATTLASGAPEFMPDSTYALSVCSAAPESSFKPAAGTLMTGCRGTDSNCTVLSSAPDDLGEGMEKAIETAEDHRHDAKTVGFTTSISGKDGLNVAEIPESSPEPAPDICNEAQTGRLPSCTDPAANLPLSIRSGSNSAKLVSAPVTTSGGREPFHVATLSNARWGSNECEYVAGRVCNALRHAAEAEKPNECGSTFVFIRALQKLTGELCAEHGIDPSCGTITARDNSV